MECAELLKKLGDRIKTIRKGQKLSQEVLAERANLHPIYISKVESGRVRASICTYDAIASALGVTLSELTELPGNGAGWDSSFVVLLQKAKHLDKERQLVFMEAVKGILTGLGGG